MIRVNLLPIKEARQRSAGRIQLAIFVLILIAEIAGFVALYMMKSRQVDAIRTKVEDARATVQKLKSRVDETRKFEKKAEKLQQKRETLEKIQSQSIGPGPLLRELQVLLSEPRNIEERYAQREKGWNVEWNPNHLWIETLEETDKKFTLLGRAVDADDVAEFLHRLETASHFHDVKLDYVRPTDDSGARSLVEFRVTGTITYRAKRAEKSGAKGSSESKDENKDDKGS